MRGLACDKFVWLHGMHTRPGLRVTLGSGCCAPSCAWGRRPLVTNPDSLPAAATPAASCNSVSFLAPAQQSKMQQLVGCSQKRRTCSRTRARRLRSDTGGSSGVPDLPCCSSIQMMDARESGITMSPSSYTGSCPRGFRRVTRSDLCSPTVHYRQHS
jgi:hypothetical protein